MRRHRRRGHGAAVPCPCHDLHMRPGDHGLGSGGAGCVVPSNASRSSDRLLRAGLLDRRESPVDRRNVSLTLTPAGWRLVEKVTKHCRRAIERVLRKMPPSQRDTLAAALATFASAAGEPFDDANILTMLWPPARPDPAHRAGGDAELS